MEQGESGKQRPPYIYECEDCGYRVEADEQPMECPECGSTMANISRPRE